MFNTVAVHLFLTRGFWPLCISPYVFFFFFIYYSLLFYTKTTKSRHVWVMNSESSVVAWKVPPTWPFPKPRSSRRDINSLLHEPTPYRSTTRARYGIVLISYARRCNFFSIGMLNLVLYGMTSFWQRVRVHRYKFTLKYTRCNNHLTAY